MMRICFTAFLLSISLAVNAQKPNDEELVFGGGVIFVTPTRDADGKVVTDDNGMPEFSALVADHRRGRRGHSAPGGGTDELNDLKGIARETDEESGGFFEAQKIHQILMSGTTEHVTNRFRIPDRKRPGKTKLLDYTAHIIVVDQIDLEKLENATDKAAKTGRKGQDERIGYTTLPLDELDRVVESPNKEIAQDFLSDRARTKHVFGAFIVTYKTARSKIDTATKEFVDEQMKEKHQASETPTRKSQALE